MNNAVVIPAEEYKEIKDRLHSLEEKVTALMEEKEKEDDAIFIELVNSERFQRELEEDLELLKKDPSKFVDPFETYKKRNAE